MIRSYLRIFPYFVSGASTYWCRARADSSTKNNIVTNRYLNKQCFPFLCCFVASFICLFDRSIHNNLLEINKISHSVRGAVINNGVWVFKSLSRSRSHRGLSMNSPNILANPKQRQTHKTNEIEINDQVC